MLFAHLLVARVHGILWERVLDQLGQRCCSKKAKYNKMKTNLAKVGPAWPYWDQLGPSWSRTPYPTVLRTPDNTQHLPAKSPILSSMPFITPARPQINNFKTQTQFNRKRTFHKLQRFMHECLHSPLWHESRTTMASQMKKDLAAQNSHCKTSREYQAKVLGKLFCLPRKH